MPTQLIDWSSGAAPLDKGLGDPLARASPAQELGEGGSAYAVRGDRDEEGEHREALARVDVRDLLREAKMPASHRSFELLRLEIGQEQGELRALPPTRRTRAQKRLTGLR
jgi:hypothetical protein